MAEGVTEPTPEERESLIRRPREEVRVHRMRFAIAYLSLAVLAGIAVGATVLAMDDSRKESSVATICVRALASASMSDHSAMMQ